jgi:D-alanine-D-alanine ligase
MLIGIVHNRPVPAEEDFGTASQDVLTQVAAVEAALDRLGHQTVRLVFDGDPGSLLLSLRALRVGAVFNLCETVNEDPRLAGHPAALFELLNLPFSGSSAMGLMLSTDKVISKHLLKAAGIRTPDFAVYEGETTIGPVDLRFPVIVKPRYQDASIGIDQESIFADPGELSSKILEIFNRFGPLLIEEFVDGREFNLSLLGDARPEVLPLAEIDFSHLPDGLHRIVGYRAKWDPETVEYRGTPRTFLHDVPWGLTAEMTGAAQACFHLLSLRDYVRIDIRLDRRGLPYILEVNANPCLSPDAGFAAAAQAAGLSYTDLIGRILGFVLRRTALHENSAAAARG